jgi:hypothetical protein
LTTIIETHPGIRKYQIVQTDRARLRVAFISYQGKVASRDLSVLAQRLCDTLGEHLDVGFEEVTEIPRTPRGKHKVFVGRQTLQDETFPHHPPDPKE